MPPLVLSEGDVQQLQALAKSRSLPHSIGQRAQIVLACGACETNTAIAKRAWPDWDDRRQVAQALSGAGSGRSA